MEKSYHKAFPNGKPYVILFWNFKQNAERDGTMGKPDILISLGSELTVNYAEAVSAFGGVPHGVYLPEADAEKYDALILSGGADVDPAFYGETNTACFGIDRARDEAEFRLIEAFRKAGKPILGICRGHQVLNVYFGGTLIQHLAMAEKHQWTKTGDSVHETDAEAGSFLAEMYGTHFSVNSAHHQGIDRLAEELQIVQTAPDGTVEACVHKEEPVWSVQWHPERMCLSRARADTVDGGKVFRWFIGEVRKRMK